MKKYIKTVLLLAVFAVGLLFCSCMARPNINISCTDLPEGMSLKALVRIDESGEDFEDKPKNYPRMYVDEAVTSLDSADGSETESCVSYSELTAEEVYGIFLERVNEVGEEHLYIYNEDGWRSADYFTDCETMKGKLYFPARFSDEQDFVTAYPELRIAVMDGDGRVCKVSGIADMTPKGKRAVYTGLEYSYESNTLTPDGLRYTKTNGRSPDSYLLWFYLLFCVLNILMIPFLVIMFAAYRSGKNHKSVGFVIAFCFLSAGNFLFTANYLILEILPVFDLGSDGLTLSDIVFLLYVNKIWIIELIIFLVIRTRPQRVIMANFTNYPSYQNQYNERNFRQ
ncbi:MAG: hypothetical protein ACI4JW_04020 [Oscillospiraceae bacterium]